jgi:hypothetical protein
MSFCEYGKHSWGPKKGEEALPQFSGREKGSASEITLFWIETFNQRIEKIYIAEIVSSRTYIKYNCEKVTFWETTL